MGDGIGRGIFEIAMALMSLALISMLVSKSSQVTPLITTGANAFSQLLGAATMSNGMMGGSSYF